jgi:hypothetical protein
MPNNIIINNQSNIAEEVALTTIVSHQKEEFKYQTSLHIQITQK